MYAQQTPWGRAHVTRKSRNSDNIDISESTASSELPSILKVEKMRTIATMARKGTQQLGMVNHVVSRVYLPRLLKTIGLITGLFSTNMREERSKAESKQKKKKRVSITMPGIFSFPPNVNQLPSAAPS
jgi:hypothetical protein